MASKTSDAASAQLPSSRRVERSPEVESEIISLLSLGESVRQIGELDGMPDDRTIQRWIAADEAFASKCAHARAQSADIDVDEMRELADEEPPTDAHGRMDSGFIAWKRNQISARQWRAEKLAPKKYGAKQEIDLTGNVTLVLSKQDVSVL